jgi:phosphatidylglycerophosphate synthase
VTRTHDSQGTDIDMERRRISIADVKATFGETQVREAFTVRWFGRPLSDICTPAFHNHGWTANDVTYFTAVLSFLAVIGLLFEDQWILGIVVIAYYVNFVLDCVDGNLARVGDDASYWGKFIDGLADGVYGVFTPFALGIGLWLATDNGWLLIAGAATTVVALYCDMVRTRRGFFREWMVAQTGPLTPQESSEPRFFYLLERIGVWILVNVTFFLPLLLSLRMVASTIYWVLSSFRVQPVLRG